MRFHKKVPQEKRELLTEQLKKYEKEMAMTSEERKELHKWVASGRSPYENGNYIHDEGGYPMDFVSAMRAEQEQLEWFRGLSEEEKQKLIMRAEKNDANRIEVEPNRLNEELPF